MTYSKYARWQCEQLTSQDAESYCKSENDCMKESLEKQCQHNIDAASGSSDVCQHIPDTPKSIACKKSCKMLFSNCAKCLFVVGYNYFAMSKACASVGGIVVRGCASSLLGSYVHQELI